MVPTGPMVWPAQSRRRVHPSRSASQAGSRSPPTPAVTPVRDRRRCRWRSGGPRLRLAHSTCETVDLGQGALPVARDVDEPARPRALPPARRRLAGQVPPATPRQHSARDSRHRAATGPWWWWHRCGQLDDLADGLATHEALERQRLADQEFTSRGSPSSPRRPLRSGLSPAGGARR